MRRRCKTWMMMWGGASWNRRSGGGERVPRFWNVFTAKFLFFFLIMLRKIGETSKWGLSCSEIAFGTFSLFKPPSPNTDSLNSSVVKMDAGPPSCLALYYQFMFSGDETDRRLSLSCTELQNLNFPNSP